MLASLQRVGAIAAKEVLQLRRDRVSFGLIVMMPLVQLLLFGYGIETDVREVPAALVDNAHSSFSRQLAQDIQASQMVRFTHSVATPAELDQLIVSGEVMAGLVIPRDVEQRFYSGQPPIAQLIVDGSDTMVAGSLLLPDSRRRCKFYYLNDCSYRHFHNNMILCYSLIQTCSLWNRPVC